MTSNDRNGVVKIDLDKIVEKSRARFKNKEKAFGEQLVRGSGIVKPSEDSDFVCWKDSPWELLTSIRGIPYGKIVQISGKPDSGKSTHAMEFMTRAQKQGDVVILWDAEGKFSAKRFDNYFGGCSDDLLLVPNKMILEGADLLDAYVHSTMEINPDQKVLLVWDSVGGSLPTAEMTKSKRDSRQMAEASKENAIVCRGFVQLMETYRNRSTNKYNIGTLLINQTYANIGAPGQVESGGQKVAYFSSLITQLTRKADLFKVRDKVKRKIGISTRARVKKNHLFEGEDTIAEMILDITAGGVSVNKKDPAYKLVGKDFQSAADIEEEDDNEDGWDGE